MQDRKKEQSDEDYSKSYRQNKLADKIYFELKKDNLTYEDFEIVTSKIKLSYKSQATL